jgi:hypothetical protein
MQGMIHSMAFPMRAPLAIVLSAIAAWSLSIAAAWSQDAKDPKWVPDKSLATKRLDVMRMLSRPQALSAAEQRALDEYFNKYALLLLADEKSDLPKERKQLQAYFKSAARNPAVHAHLMKLVLAKYTQMILDGDLPMAVRINAMIVVGDLNEQESPGAPVTPLPDARRLLMAALQSSKAPDALKIVSLQALRRHAELDGIPPDAVPSMQALMIRLITQQEPPRDRTKAGHVWLQELAAEVLGAIGSPGVKNSVVSACNDVLADPKASLEVRCAMAKCLSQLKLPDNGVDVKSLASGLGYLAVDICRRESERLQSAATPPEVRRLIPQLRAVRAGLGGANGRGVLLALAKPGEQQNFVAAVDGRVKSTLNTFERIDELQGPSTTSDALANNLEATAKALEGILPPRPAATPRAPAGVAEQPDKNGAGREQNDADKAPGISARPANSSPAAVNVPSR